MLGKYFEDKRKIIKLAFHETEVLLYTDIVYKRKFSQHISNTFIHHYVIQLFE